MLNSFGNVGKVGCALAQCSVIQRIIQRYPIEAFIFFIDILKENNKKRG